MFRFNLWIYNSERTFEGHKKLVMGETSNQPLVQFSFEKEIDDKHILWDLGWTVIAQIWSLTCFFFYFENYQTKNIERMVQCILTYLSPNSPSVNLLPCNPLFAKSFENIYSCRNISPISTSVCIFQEWATSANLSTLWHLRKSTLIQ